MKYKTNIAILALSLVSLTACNNAHAASVTTHNNLLINGDFENGSSTHLSGWTQIDSGITVAKNRYVYKTGSSSAAVRVKTGNQANTDFRQNVDVQSGKTYTLSMWVYHTEGNIKTRVYLAGYKDYSDANLVNQWQKLSFEYTASDNLNIEVGMRFYDLAGFDGSETVYIDNVTFTDSSDTSTTPLPSEPSVIQADTRTYYRNAENKTGFTLKTALYNIIKGHTTKSYTNVWSFFSANSLDKYYEKDNSILDMYSEIPSSSDTYKFTPVNNQCGNYRAEGDCYNREHSMPQSWFNKASPMVSDVHHIFATDGKVNSYRSNYPYGEVGSASFISDNGSQLGRARSGLGYTGTVFEPIDEFKGDFARAYFYMATRYQDRISSWERNSDTADAILDGSNNNVFEPWVIAMLKRWNQIDPVSQKEIDRNEAAYQYQGNRNPFVNHPEYVNKIWVD